MTSHRCPIDEYAIIERLKDWELKAHNNASKHPGFTKGLEYKIEEKAYGRVINLIQNGRVRQAHHRLVPVSEERLGTD